MYRFKYMMLLWNMNLSSKKKEHIYVWKLFNIKFQYNTKCIYMVIVHGLERIMYYILCHPFNVVIVDDINCLRILPLML